MTSASRCAFSLPSGPTGGVSMVRFMKTILIRRTRWTMSSAANTVGDQRLTTWLLPVFGATRGRAAMPAPSILKAVLL